MRSRPSRPARVAAALSACALVAACGGSSDAGSSAAGEPSAGPAPSPAATSAATGGGAQAERVRAVLDGVELDLEVADDRSERAVGLMGRTEVPPGTGMVFLYDEPSEGRYWMFDVPVPLRAVFVREGRVVSTVVMPPCEEPVARDCETYGADGPYDTVVETAPETLPDVQPGDVFELRG